KGEQRGYAGTVAGGVFRPGDDVVVLPSGFTTSISAIWAPGGSPVTEAFGPQAVSLELADHVDVGRGSLICRPGNRPHAGQELDAMVCWLTEHSALTPGGKYTLRHTTQQVRAAVRALDYRLDINTLHRDSSADRLSINEIGRVALHTQSPLMFDAY